MEVDVDQTRALQRDELVLGGEQMQLSSLIEFKIVGWGSRNFDCVRVGNETLKPNLHLLALAKSFLDKVGLTLEEDQFTTWEHMLFVQL